MKTFHLGIVSVAFILISSPHSSLGQFQDITSCLTPQFLQDVVGCVLAKFDGIGDTMSSQYDSPGTSTGRKLQSVGLGMSSSPVHLYMANKMEKHPHYAEFLSQLLEWVKLIQSGAREETIMDKLKHTNPKKLFGDYLTKFSLLPVILAEKMEMAQRVADDFKRRLASEERSSDSYSDARVNTIICDILPSLCSLTTCLQQYNETDFQDNVDWIQCILDCTDGPPLSMCINNLFVNSDNPACGEVAFMGDILIGIIASAFKISECYYEITEPVNVTATIELVEGGEAKYLELTPNFPPGTVCLGPDPLTNIVALGANVLGNVYNFDVPCTVQLELTGNNYLADLLPYISFPGRPPLIPGAQLNNAKCRESNRLIHQMVVGEYDDEGHAAGIIPLTEDNWNVTKRIPLMAVVDHRKDGDTIDMSLTIKVVVNGNIVNTQIIKVNVIDRDVADLATVQCYSVNDPHIMTFDGSYYNNYYQGAFYLYKHLELPYEVQAIYQSCSLDSDVASCACAVAVKSGDDVLVIDRCRRDPPVPSVTCESDECVPQAMLMYVNGDVTPGTRVFGMDEGLRHDIILPHGTVIKVVNSRYMLNVWIMPSTYDLNKTEGLCGSYNGDPTNDFRMPDGSEYTGNDTNDHPSEFNQAWRVPDEELAFIGLPALEPEFRPLNVCYCSNVVFNGADCQCDAGVLTETCDMYLYGEYSRDAMSSFIVPSQNNGIDLAGINRFMDKIAMDVNLEPSPPTWGPTYTLDSATAFCESYFAYSTNVILQSCGDAIPEAATRNCVEDIQLTDDTKWAMAAADNAKMACLNAVVRDPDAALKDLLETYQNGTCVNDCSGNGECINGRCHCDGSFAGGDCSLSQGVTPRVFFNQSLLCDTRKQICSHAIYFGANLLDDGSMTCRAQEVQIGPGGVNAYKNTPTHTMDMIFVSKNQVACPLPSDAASYEVKALWNGEQLATSGVQRRKRSTDGATLLQVDEFTLIFMSHDSTCYVCDDITLSCDVKDTNNFCLIGGVCVANGDPNPALPCKYCNATTNADGWTWRETEQCQTEMQVEVDEEDSAQHELLIRATVAGSLSLVVCIIVFIAFLISRNRQDTKLEIMPAEDSIAYGTKTSKPTHNGIDNPALSSDEDETQEESASRAIASPLPLDVLRVKAEMNHRSSIGSRSSLSRNRKSEDQRMRSESVSSVASAGIGGGGPTPGIFDFQNSDADYGLGGGHMTPPASRQYFERTQIHL